MGILQNIPLFPLGTVLFPKQYLPLHIFEDRYKQMIGECLRDQSQFGVVLIRAGREAGGPAIPFETGTTARIVDMERARMRSTVGMTYSYNAGSKRHTPSTEPLRGSFLDCTLAYINLPSALYP